VRESEEEKGEGERGEIIPICIKNREVEVVLYPPHGAWGSVSSRKPREGGLLRMKWADAEAKKRANRVKTKADFIFGTVCKNNKKLVHLIIT
jgi:hypothetical protein